MKGSPDKRFAYLNMGKGVAKMALGSIPLLAGGVGVVLAASNLLVTAIGAGALAVGGGYALYHDKNSTEYIKNIPDYIKQGAKWTKGQFVDGRQAFLAGKKELVKWNKATLTQSIKKLKGEIGKMDDGLEKKYQEATLAVMEKKLQIYKAKTRTTKQKYKGELIKLKREKSQLADQIRTSEIEQRINRYGTLKQKCQAVVKEKSADIVMLLNSTKNYAKSVKDGLQKQNLTSSIQKLQKEISLLDDGKEKVYKQAKIDYKEKQLEKYTKNFNTDDKKSEYDAELANLKKTLDESLAHWNEERGGKNRVERFWNKHKSKLPGKKKPQSS